MATYAADRAELASAAALALIRSRIAEELNNATKRFRFGSAEGNGSYSYP
jgi:hypothetical protein